MLLKILGVLVVGLAFTMAGGGVTGAPQTTCELYKVEFPTDDTYNVVGDESREHNENMDENYGGLIIFTKNKNDDELKYLIFTPKSSTGAASFDKNGKSLPSPFFWSEKGTPSLPMGGLEHRENFLQAAIRVSLEQTGLKSSHLFGLFPTMAEIKIVSNYGAISTRFMTSFFGRNTITKIQFFAVFTEVERATGNHELGKCEWMTLEKAKKVWAGKDGKQPTEGEKLCTDVLTKVDTQLQYDYEEVEESVEWIRTSGYIDMISDRFYKSELDVQKMKYPQNEWIRKCCGKYNVRETFWSVIEKIDETKTVTIISGKPASSVKISFKEVLGMFNNEIVKTYNDGGSHGDAPTQFDKIQTYVFHFAKQYSGDRKTLHRICWDMYQVMIRVFAKDDSKKSLL